MKRFLILWLVIFMLLCGCAADDDDPSTSSGQTDDDSVTDDDDDSADDDTTVDDDDFFDDDDDTDDDDDDDTSEVTPNPDAKSDGFRLFYRERSMRILKSINMFALSGDVVFANTFLKIAIAKTGNDYEVVAGPEGNNPFGSSAYVAWKLYQAIGGRELELTLIRMFEGLAFNEAVSGHPGLTTREAFPGWTRTINGVTGEITRTKWGAPVTSPVTYPSVLEQEIIDTFFDGLTFTYRENPEEYYFNFKPINELGNFAATYVFEELDHEPPFLRVSDCCSSFMISQMGTWEGAYWGNHNSRDNFTDYVMGFLAAFEAENTTGLPADLALAAHNAAEAARRTGDTTVAYDNVLMTVDEHHDYYTLRPAGEMNPDEEEEWQDLGSLASCQMAYLAHAISNQGLTTPVPTIPLPGAIETAAIRDLLEGLGIEIPLPVLYCNSLDDAFIGITWGQILDLQVLGLPWYEWAYIVEQLIPGTFYQLLASTMDDFQELELGAVGLCYYAQISGDDALYQQARQTLENFVEIQKILARLVYGISKKKGTRDLIIAEVGAEAFATREKSTQEMLYKAATYARMFGLDWPLEDFDGFAMGEQRNTFIEDQLVMPDTTPWPLITDQDIYNQVEAKLAGWTVRAPWRIDRYRDRFDHEPPVRLNGTQDGYECIGPNDQWMPTENPSHDWFEEFKLWFEAPLCIFSPETLDCKWAAIGCAPADFDQNGVVDSSDLTLFDNAFATWGTQAVCNQSNDWCSGADLDKSGSLNSEDQDFMNAADGCWY